MKTQTITLRIVYDPEITDDPISWDWNILLDLGPDESVTVIDNTTPTDLPS